MQVWKQFSPSLLLLSRELQRSLLRQFLNLLLDWGISGQPLPWLWLLFLSPKVILTVHYSYSKNFQIQHSSSFHLDWKNLQPEKMLSSYIPKIMNILTEMVYMATCLTHLTGQWSTSEEEKWNYMCWKNHLYLSIWNQDPAVRTKRRELKCYMKMKDIVMFYVF